MPRSNSTQPRPVIKPTATILVGTALVLLAAGLTLLFFGRTDQHTVAAFFFLALLGATVTFGILGATGMVKTKRWQLGGSAGVFGAILLLLLPFARTTVHEVKGTVFLDDAVVREATVVLLETDRAGNEQRITPQDNGTFRFMLVEQKKSYKFRVLLPNLGETNLVVPATDGWLSLRLVSKVLVPHAANPLASLGELCKAESEGCTLFLFDYLNNDIGGDELQAFQNFQAYRLDKGIRDYLSARNLLAGLDFRVQRCATASVKDASLASQAAAVLKVPAVMWGFIKRSDNKLISATTFTVLDRQAMHLATREVLGNDVTELMGLDRAVKGTPLAIATLMIGDLHLKQARPDLARRAYLHANELAADIEPRDQADFLKAVKARLQRLEASNPAATLTPIGDTHG